ncbi:hypothetical protein Pelo_6841 [Pelomyxa schiedti]|nr:hypothetical protein Pelo_6841 [Pelomyxa schiedti]
MWQPQQRSHINTVYCDNDGRQWEVLPKTEFPMHQANRLYTRVRCLNYDKLYYTQALLYDFMGLPNNISLGALNTQTIFPEMLTITRATHPKDYQMLVQLGVSPPDSDIICLSTLEGIRAKVTEILRPTGPSHNGAAPPTLPHQLPVSPNPAAVPPILTGNIPVSPVNQIPPGLVRSPIIQQFLQNFTPQQILLLLQQQQHVQNRQLQQLQQLQPLVPHNESQTTPQQQIPIAQTAAQQYQQPQPQQKPPPQPQLQQQFPLQQPQNTTRQFNTLTSSNTSPSTDESTSPPGFPTSASNISTSTAACNRKLEFSPPTLLPRMTWGEVINEVSNIDSALQQVRNCALNLHSELQQLASIPSSEQTQSQSQSQPQQNQQTDTKTSVLPQQQTTVSPAATTRNNITTPASLSQHNTNTSAPTDMGVDSYDFQQLWNV